MRIAVCIKQVPDTWSEKTLREDNLRLDRAAVDGVLNDLDEHAMEEALVLAESNGAEVVAVCVGPEGAGDTIRKALSMGADSAIHVIDPGMGGADALGTATVLAEVLKAESFDLVIFGSESTDARMGVVPVMISEMLGMPALTFSQKVAFEGSTVTSVRATDSEVVTESAELPCIVSVVQGINEPRYPSFKGIMAAKKKPVETKDLGALGLAPASVGGEAALSEVVSFEVRPPKTAGTKVEDDGNGGAALAQFLIDNKFI